MIVAHNGTCTMHCNVQTDIRIAKETGYEAIEIIGFKLYRYQDQGLAIADLVEELAGFPVVGLGYVQDIERQEPQQVEAMLADCDRMCRLAVELGCPLVQLLTGPIAPGLHESDGYRGLAGRSWPEIRELTARNLRQLSAIGKQYGRSFYLEPLSWTPLHTLAQGLELIDYAEVDNVAMLLDFWHLWTSGSTPDEIARLDPRQIGCVHFCDSLAIAGRPITHHLREVWTGAGHIPLKDWLDAVRATGYDGWMAGELFSPRHWELDPWRVARNLSEMMRITLV